MLARSCCWRASACCLCVNIQVTWVLQSRVQVIMQQLKQRFHSNLSQLKVGLKCEVFSTYNQQQPGGVAAAAVKAQADEDAALLTWCTPSCSCPLASSSFGPSLRLNSSGATASSPGSVHSVHGSAMVNCCRCSWSLRLQRRKWQNPNLERTTDCHILFKQTRPYIKVSSFSQTLTFRQFPFICSG